MREENHAALIHDEALNQESLGRSAVRPDCAHSSRQLENGVRSAARDEDAVGPEAIYVCVRSNVLNARARQSAWRQERMDSCQIYSRHRDTGRLGRLPKSW